MEGAFKVFMVAMRIAIAWTLLSLLLTAFWALLLEVGRRFGSRPSSKRSAPEERQLSTDVSALKPAPHEPAKPAGSPSAKPVRKARLQQKADGSPLPHRKLTDAQVLKLLEQRRVGTRLIDGEANRADTAVLGPEDTNTPLVLREADKSGRK